MEQAVFEKLGVQYKEEDGLLYPVLPVYDMADVSQVGKYGRLWLRLLYEIDRKRYHELQLEGELICVAMKNDERGYCVLEEQTQRYLSQLSKSQKHSTMAMWQVRIQAQLMAEEIIIATMTLSIEKHREQRLKPL